MDELTLRGILEESSFPYLAAYEEEWIDAHGKTISFDEMGKLHLMNCYKMLERQKKTIERGRFLQGVKFNKSQYDDIVEMTKELYYKKMDELKNYLKI